MSLQVPGGSLAQLVESGHLERDLVPHLPHRAAQVEERVERGNPDLPQCITCNAVPISTSLPLRVQFTDSRPLSVTCATG